MSLISSNGTLLLLHRGLTSVKKANSYDLVLSPQFYIVKREKVPVKYAFQAKKLAPSILEDMLPSEIGHEFIVQKDGDSWLFYAYMPREIEHFMENECRIPAYKINTIYFADQLKPVLEKFPIGIDEYSALTLIDGFATIVPRDMLKSDKYAKFNKKLRPDKGFKFKSSRKVGKSSKIDKSAITTAILSVLLGAAFLTEGVSYKRAAKHELENITANSDNPQLQSKLTRDSIKQKYQKIETKQRAIRETLAQFSKMASKRTILSNLNFDGKTVKATFSTNAQELKRVKNLAKRAKLKIVNSNNKGITVERAIK